METETDKTEAAAAAETENKILVSIYVRPSEIAEMKAVTKIDGNTACLMSLARKGLEIERTKMNLALAAAAMR